MAPENTVEIRARPVEGGLDSSRWDDFNYAWSALAGREAIDFAMTSEGTDIKAVLSGWSAANPGEAIAFLEDFPESLAGQRQTVERSLIAGLADADPALATDEALRLGANSSRLHEGKEKGSSSHARELIDSVAEKAIRIQGAAGASKWVESLPDGDVKANAMLRIAESFVKEDPEAAAAWPVNSLRMNTPPGLLEKWESNGAVGIPKQRSPGWRPFRMERDQPQDSAK